MTVGILGLGLIGGSMARAYRKAGHRVLASDTDGQMLSFAKLAGAVSGELTGENIPECDLILLCVYPEASAAWLEKHGAEIAKTALVLDQGSDLQALFPGGGAVRVYVCGRPSHGRVSLFRLQVQSLQPFSGSAHGACAAGI